jgi:hypothetical protein
MVHARADAGVTLCGSVTWDGSGGDKANTCVDIMKVTINPTCMR